MEDVRAGIVPSLILTIFLGMFALFTAKLLLDFKLNHPEVHSMGWHRNPSFSCLRLMLYRRCGIHHVRTDWTRGPISGIDHVRIVWAGELRSLLCPDGGVRLIKRWTRHNACDHGRCFTFDDVSIATR